MGTLSAHFVGVELLYSSSTNAKRLLVTAGAEARRTDLNGVRDSGINFFSEDLDLIVASA